METKQRRCRKSYLIVSPEWGTLVIRPTEATCAGWSEMFPFGSPVLFSTRREACEVAKLWDASMGLLIGEAPRV